MATAAAVAAIAITPVARRRLAALTTDSSSERA
jgi:hypothetical protein